MQRIAALETRGDEAHQILQRVTEVAEAEQQRNAMLEAAVTQLTASAQPRSNVLNAGFCNPSLIPLLFFTKDITAFCNWDPGDGTSSVRVQIEHGAEPRSNGVVRSMLAQYFGRGPFLG
jgi:hypothetical protein